MSYGFFRPRPEIPQALYRNRSTVPRAVPPGLHVPGTVYSNVGATSATVLAMAEDHYGVSTVDALAAKLDPLGRSMEDFCQGWWGKSFANSIHEVLILERITQLIRQSSRRQGPMSTSPTFFLNYHGGDLLDTAIATQTGVDQGRRFWIGSDYLVAQMNGVDLGTNLVRSSTLPNRNHLTTEFKDTEVDIWSKTRSADGVGAGFRTMSGESASTWHTPNQTNFPSTIYWPIALTPTNVGGFIFYIVAWLVKTPTAGNAFYDHEITDTHILGVNIFGTVSTVDVFDIGVNGTFYGDDVLEDTSFTYVYGREHVPVFGDGTPNYGQNLETTDTTYKRVGRVAAGTEIASTGHAGTVFTNYEFWTGSGWSTDLANATRLVDTGGTAIAGDAGVAKIATNHYVLVAQQHTEDHRRVYFASTPTGPWWHYTNVPTPIYGLNQLGAGISRTCWLTKVFSDFPASANRVMTTSTNLSYGNPYDKVGKHIVETDHPYYVSVPTDFGDHVPAPPSNVHRMRPLLVR